jgi:hypothetical protein
MATIGGSNIVTNGLVLSLDAANRRSYPGSGTAWSDVSGNAYNQILYNGIGYNNANSGILTYDGVDDYSYSSTTVSSGNVGFTVSIWINAQTWTNNSCPCTGATSIIDWSTGYWNVFGLQSNGAPSWYIYNQDPTIPPNPPAGTSLGFGASPLNTWLNLVCTFANNNPGTMSSYTNGIFNASTTLQSTFTITSNFNINGYHRHCGNCYCQFKLGNVSLYNRPLTALEVINNYNAQKSRFDL